MSSITSIASVPASNPTQASNSSTLQDIATIHSRRLETIIESIAGNSSNISTWFVAFAKLPNYAEVNRFRIAGLQGDGKWLDSDINYTAGCDGRRANWPAAEHWVRISQLPDTQLDIIHPQCTHASSQVRWLLLGMGDSIATTNMSTVRQYSLPLAMPWTTGSVTTLRTSAVLLKEALTAVLAARLVIGTLTGMLTCA